MAIIFCSGRLWDGFCSLTWNKVVTILPPPNPLSACFHYPHLLLQKGVLRIVHMSNMTDTVSLGYPNTEKRVENMMCSEVFSTKFEVF